MDRYYYVYMMTNKTNSCLYTGMTNDVVRRVYEHKTGKNEGFTKKYNLHKLVYFEITNDVHHAIRREKIIKGWLRSKKNALVESRNPLWEDLAADWYEGWDMGGDSSSAKPPQNDR